MASFDYKLDFVWALWTSFVDYNYATWVGPIEGPDRIIGNFDQCVNMTEAVLERGCDIENVLHHDPLRPGLLFDLAGRQPLGMVDFWVFVKALTKQYEPHAVRSIKAFIEARADIHDIDKAGRGALHCALAPPGGVLLCFSATPKALLDFEAPETPKTLGGASNYYYWCAQKYDTENGDYAKHYSDEGLDPYPLLYSDIAENEDDGVSAKNELVIEHIFCKDDWNDEHLIRNPIQVLKKGLRFKLLALLKAGCDPNLVDKEGKCLSSYAERDGLWPQWSWAFVNSGYMLDGQSGRWVKASPG